MSDPEQLAEISIRTLSNMLAPGVEVDPVLVARLAGVVTGALMGNSWEEALRVGEQRAARIKTVADAEAAAAARK